MRELYERLRQANTIYCGLEEREQNPAVQNDLAEIEQMPDKVDAALNLREDAGPGESSGAVPPLVAFDDAAS